MKKLMTKVLGGFLVLLTSVSVAFATCGPKQNVEEMLLNRYGEILLNFSEETGTALFGNCTTGTFTILKVAPESIKPESEKGKPGWCYFTHGTDKQGLKNNKACSQGV